MKCPHCAGKNRPAARFCDQCGAELGGGAPFFASPQGLQAVIDAFPGPFFLKSTENDLLMVNQALAEQQGLGAGAGSGKPGRGFPKGVRERLAGLIEPAGKTGGKGSPPGQWEVELSLPRGKKALHRLVRTPLLDAGGHVRGFAGRLEALPREAKGAEPPVGDPYHGLVEKSLQGVVVHDRKSRILCANQAFLTMFGFAHPEEVVGTSMDDRIALEELKELKASRKRLGNGDGAVYRGEIRGLKKDGTPIWLEFVAHKITWDGSPATRYFILNITGRREAERSLRIHQARFRALVEGTIEGILVFQEGVIKFANEAAAKMYGFSSSRQLIGTTIDDRIDPTDLQRLVGYREARMKGYDVPNRYEFRARKKDGTPIWVENLIHLTTWDGAKALQATHIDVTARKKAESDLRARNDQIQEDLDIAAEFQQSILPPVFFPAFLEVAYEFRPFGEVSGDMYDLFTNREGEFSFFLGDATGHGVSAAFLAMMIQIGLDGIRGDLSTHQTLEELNGLIAKKDKGGRFVTCLLMRFSPDGSLAVTNAGHPPLFVIPRKNQEPVTVFSSGLPIGLFGDREQTYREWRYRLQPGDKVVAYSDGLIEFCDPGGEPFGINRLGAFLKKQKKLEINGVLEKLLEEVKSFSGGLRCNDDMTVFGFEYLGPKRAARKAAAP